MSGSAAGGRFTPSLSDLREAARDAVAGDYGSFAGQYSEAQQIRYLREQLERRAKTPPATKAAATVAPCRAG